MSKDKIDPRIYDLYDEYCHTPMERREFLSRAAAITIVGGGSALAMAEMLLPRYAEAQMISFTDKRIKASYVTYDSPGGNSGKMRGYLVQPTGSGPFPSVEDVARRFAVEGFLALAPDALSVVGGYPGNDDDGKKMQAGLNRPKIQVDMVNSAKYLKSHSLSNRKLGAVGFCFGGLVVNNLAVSLGGDLNAGVPFYGRAPKSEDVSKIKAPMLIQYAENDKNVNATKPAYEAALKASKATFEMHTYPGTGHGFHNNSTSRYNEAAAKQAWDRTIAFFKKHLS
jgi:carboxymethylenebutenolidase